MTHEEYAKRFIENLILGAKGFVGPGERKQVDDFYDHLKKAITKECGCDCRH